MADGCLFAEYLLGSPTPNLEPRIRTEAIRSYARHVMGFLQDYSYEEYGDELPGCATSTNEICQATFDGNIPDNALNIVIAAVSCAQKIYLGQCAIDSCPDGPAVKEAIARLPQKQQTA